MSFLFGLLAIAVAAYFGGWEWALLTLVASACSFRQSIVSALSVSFLWLALFCWSGDRRLYFPFAMQFAVQIPFLIDGRVARPWILGGGGTVVLFLLIRIAQSATIKVLVVEAIVATVILVFLHILRGYLGEGTKTRVMAGAIASVLAFIGLVF